MKTVSEKAQKPESRRSIEFMASLVASAEELNDVQDAYRSTEMRLKRLPSLVKRISYNKGEYKALSELEFDKLRNCSKSFTALIRPGMRVDMLDAHAAQLAYLKAQINIDRFEVRRVKDALRVIRDDPYYATVAYRYFDDSTDDETAKRLACSVITVRRHRHRLVRELASLLYGAAAE